MTMRKNIGKYPRPCDKDPFTLSKIKWIHEKRSSLCVIKHEIIGRCIKSNANKKWYHVFWKFHINDNDQYTTKKLAIKAYEKKIKNKFEDNIEFLKNICD